MDTHARIAVVFCMRDIFTSIFIFISTVVVHVYLHRLLKRHSINTLKTIFIFPIGVIGTVLIVFTQDHLPSGSLWTLPLPLTSLALYGLMATLHVMLFASYFFNAESPSAKLLFMVRRKGALARHRIFSSFSNESLILKRLEGLVVSGYARKKGAAWTITPKGARAASLIEWYRSLLRWDKGG